MARLTTERYLPLNQRLLQHLLLLPVFLVSYWASLRNPVASAGDRAAVAADLGAVFAAVAYPAMLVAGMTLGGEDWHKEVMAHGGAAPWPTNSFCSRGWPVS